LLERMERIRETLRRFNDVIHGVKGLLGIMLDQLPARAQYKAPFSRFAAKGKVV